MKNLKWILILSFLSFSSLSNARVFDFSKEFFAAYIRGSYGPSTVAQNAFANSSGTSVSFDQTADVNYSGEFGFLFSMNKLSLRIGGEYLFAKQLSAVNGTNTAGTSLYTLKSQVNMLTPTITLEVPIKQGPGWKWLFGLGYGFAFASLSNQYTFTTTGKTQFGLSDFEETASTQVQVYNAMTSFEFLMTDIATLMLDVGYRYIPIGKWSSNQAYTNFQGSISNTDTLKNTDGTNRSTDFSGAFAGLSLRFYFR